MLDKCKTTNKKYIFGIPLGYIKQDRSKVIKSTMFNLMKKVKTKWETKYYFCGVRVWKKSKNPYKILMEEISTKIQQEKTDITLNFQQQIQNLKSEITKCVKFINPLKSFSFKTSEDNFIKSGFWMAESWGIWMKENASIKMRFFDIQDIAFSCIMNTYVGTTPKNLKIFANNCLVYEHSGELNQVNFVIPVDVLKNDGSVILSFISEGNEQPSNGDTRKLAYGISSLSTDCDFVIVDDQLKHFVNEASEFLQYTKAKQSRFKQLSENCYVENLTLDEKIHYYQNHSKKNNKVRRLFVTSGNLSLINALCYKQQYSDAKYEDILIIMAVVGKNLFVNLDIANGFNFHQIYITSSSTLYDVVVQNQLFDIDELICFDHSINYSAIKEIFPTIPLVLILENMFLFPMLDNNPVKIYARKYLEKIDYPYDANSLNIEYLDKNIQENIVKEAKTKIDINGFNKTDKNLLFCGPDCGTLAQVGVEKINEMCSKLLDYGYKVYVKLHPRGISYDVKGCQIIDDGIPLELCDLDDFCGIISFRSNVLVTLLDLGKCPSFSYLPKEADQYENLSVPYFHKNQMIRSSYIMRKYILDWDELFKVDLSKSVEEIRKYFFDLSNQKIEQAGCLSVDENYRKTFPVDLPLNFRKER